MELDLNTKQQLASLLAKPEKVTPAHAPMLENLAKTYPYYQPLHLLLARALKDEPNYNNSLTTAALYTNGSILHQVIFEPRTLSPIENLNVVLTVGIKPDENSNPTEAAEHEQTFEEIAEVTTLPITDEIPIAEQEAIIDEEIFEEINETPAPPIPEEIKDAEVLANSSPDDIFIETYNFQEEHSPTEKAKPEESSAPAAISTETDSLQEEHIHTEEAQPAEINLLNDVFVETYNFREEHQPFTAAEKTEEPQPELTEEQPQVTEREIEPEADEQETFDEINELDSAAISINEPIVEPAATAIPEQEPILEDLPLESIVSSDFFAFEKSFSDAPDKEEKIEPETPVAQKAAAHEQEPVAENTVSKYDDDKLPYTFLWWLAKTRKDHEQIFQPYVTPKKHKNPNELQQQYVEHIFHLQTPFNVSEEAKGPINTKVAVKGKELIDTFIKNDPQIRALKPDQINNENKAKKSAEDHHDLVSETLATIYIEQMLYHKAIETYEKLSLKFPEKSRYFADLIQSLEKKI